MSLDKILCFFGRHDWAHYKSAASGNPIRACKRFPCEKIQEAYYDFLSFTWDEVDKFGELETTPPIDQD